MATQTDWSSSSLNNLWNYLSGSLGNTNRSADEITRQFSRVKEHYTEAFRESCSNQSEGAIAILTRDYDNFMKKIEGVRIQIMQIGDDYKTLKTSQEYIQFEMDLFKNVTPAKVALAQKYPEAFHYLVPAKIKAKDFTELSEKEFEIIFRNCTSFDDNVPSIWSLENFKEFVVTGKEGWFLPLMNKDSNNEGYVPTDIEGGRAWPETFLIRCESIEDLSKVSYTPDDSYQFGILFKPRDSQELVEGLMDPLVREIDFSLVTHLTCLKIPISKLCRYPFGDVLSNLPHLQKFDFSDTVPINDSYLSIDILRSLVAAKLPLTSLNLSGSRIGIEGIKLLTEILRTTPTLEELNMADIRNLSDQQNGKYKLEVIKEFAAELKKFTNLRVLNISGNEFSDQYCDPRWIMQTSEIDEIFSAILEMKTLEELDISSNTFGYIRLGTLGVHIENMTTLTKLNLEYTGQNSSYDYSYIESLTKGIQPLHRLTYLNLSAVGLSPTYLPSSLESILQNKPHMKSLQLAHMGMTGENVQTLAQTLRKMPELENLNLRNSFRDLSHELWSDLANAIADCPNLKQVDLSMNNIDLSTILPLLHKMRKLEGLVLYDNNFSVGSIEQIQPTHSLTSLYLYNCGIDSRGFEILSPTLGQAMGQLTSLHLQGNKINGNSLTILSNNLQQLTSLTSLSLPKFESKEKLTHAQAKSFAEVLVLLTHLTSLNISDIPLGAFQEGQLLKVALQNKPEMVHLTMNAVGLEGEIAIKTLREALKEMPNLKTVSLKDNNLSITERGLLSLNLTHVDFQFEEPDYSRFAPADEESSDGY